jgi:hypothetical protein
MARSGQLKPQKQSILQLIAEILTNEGDQSHTVVDYKLRMDPIWRARWESAGLDLPAPGTIKNYVSKIRIKLRNSGADRPWSILASSNSQDPDYISATDLPLILKIWRIRLAHGQQLTLRQARWISRLRYLRLWDLATDTGLSSLFRAATKYAGRDAAVGGQVDGNLNGDSFESHDLDGDLAFGGNIDEFDDLDNNERNELKVMHQAAIDAGQLTNLSGDPILTRFIESSANRRMTLDTLWRTADSVEILDEIEDLLERRISLTDMSLQQRSSLFCVMRVVFQRPEWKIKEVGSKVRLVKRIVDAVIAENWKLVADIAEMKVWEVNHDWSSKLKEERNE